MGITSLVAIDFIVLVTYTLVEGTKGNLVAKQIPHAEKPVTIDRVRVS